MSTSTTSTYIIDNEVFEFIKDDEQITEQDIEEIIEHREVFQKLCRVTSMKIRIDLANANYVWKETVAYNSINCLNELIKGMWAMIEWYKEYIAKLEEKNEHIDTRTAEEKAEEEAIINIKRQYKI